MTRVVLFCDREDDVHLARAFLSEATPAPVVEWSPRFGEPPAEAADVYVVDADFGGGRGLDVARTLAHSAPTILLARTEAAELEARAFEAGVTDILLRPEITPAGLERAIRRARLRARMPRGNGAPANVPQSVFLRRLEQGLARARRNLDGIAVLRVIEHSVERPSALPAVRAALADRVEACIDETDTMTIDAGGIWILLEGDDPRFVAARTASRVAAEIENAFMVGRRQIAVTTRIGGAVFPDHGENPTALMESARAAATDGDDGSPFFFPDAAGSTVVDRRLALESALRSALRDSELELHYQPQVDLATGRPTGVEALLRWRSGRLGPVSPVEFIPVLEQTGGIREVGEWVARQACGQAAAWAAEGFELKTSVNVSATQFKTADVKAMIEAALQEHGLDPHLLALELTESVMLEATDDVLGTLSDLRKRGVRVAIDDFGTGYASLRYVKDFPMDVLKIDREFVRGLPLSTENAAITNSIVALGRSLGLSVVAEGVETEAEAEFLRSLHCDTSQGYLHAKPMGAEAVTAWLRQQPR